MSVVVPFKSRVERNIVLMVLFCGLVPLALLAVIAMREIESQTLALAGKQLRETTKTYALELLNQLDRAESEMRLVQLGGLQLESARQLTSFSAVAAPAAQESALLLRTDGFHLHVPSADVLLRGTISFETLFAELGHVGRGVRRCVELDARLVRCDGAVLPDDERVVSASWMLPLTAVFNTSITLRVYAEQSRSSALHHVSMVARLLPMAIVAFAAIVAWFVVRRIRLLIAPLAELRRATFSVSQGEYEHRVNVQTGDEFEKLGTAFNTMTERLGNSFRKMSALSEIDRLILSGAYSEDVVRHSLLLARDCGTSDCYIVTWKPGTSRGLLFGLSDDSLSQQTIDLQAVFDRRSDESFYLVLAKVLQLNIAETFQIKSEGVWCGVLFAADRDLKSEIESQTLAELADRVSVALTNEKQASELYRQANYDGLTGLINRQAFTDRLTGHLDVSKRSGVNGALIFLDLDRFKQVNDTEGHFTGDELLRVVAQRLALTVRETDVIARLGGDEFAIIAPDCGHQRELITLCERVIESITKPIVVDRISHSIDVSMGVSVFPGDGLESAGLLMKADVAMYKAKERSGSSYAFFDRSLNEATQRRAQVETQLRTALDEKQLVLYFQPKLNLHSGEIRSVEGLLRWPGSELDLLPEEFVPVAEETGMIHLFTELLVAQSAACLERSRMRSLGVSTVAINISTQQFAREGFADQLLVSLANHKLKASALELEITESIFIQDPSHMATEMGKLRAAGVRFALDDFGTGYSSLNMLRTLPLDTLKIDRSFVAPMLSSTEALDMTSKIIEMARVLKLEVVAEGVETTAELDQLRDLGCDYIQGYVLSRALPLNELESLLIARRDNAKISPRLVASRDGA